MRRFISFNLQILPAEKASIPVISSAALYGKGIFTTIAIFGSKPFLWEKHWRRLKDNSQKLSVDLKVFSEETVKTALLKIIETNNLETGRARLSFFDDSANGIWSLKSNNKTILLITMADFRETKSEWRLTVSPFSVNSASPLANIKSCNYLENLLALEKAQKNEFDEAIRLNERGEVVSACLANVFWVKDRAVFTPGLETGCLAGTMREFLSENFAIQEVKAGLDEIIEADEIFLTSAGIGLCPARFNESKKQPFSVASEMKRFLDLQRARA